MNGRKANGALPTGGRTGAPAVAGAPAIAGRAAGDGSAWGGVRSTLRRLRVLRYLTLWPLFELSERRARRSLRWRLAESHLGTVFLSVIAISGIGAAVVVISALTEDPVLKEPASEAKDVADLLDRLGWTAGITADPAGAERVSVLLNAITTGEVGPNWFDQDINFTADIGRRFANIASISVVRREPGAPEGVPRIEVVASSDPTLVGNNAILIGAAALGVAQSALDGDTSTANNSVMRRNDDALVTGAYPVWDRAGPGEADDAVIAAVVVDKRKRSLPTGGGLALLALTYVGQMGLTIAALIGIPAIPVAAIVGMRRARAIARPISELADCARTFAEGDLSTRVENLGEDEIAELGVRFNAMADRLQISMAEEAAQRRKAEQLLAANRALVANVSHELRTPVALVRGHLEALATEPERQHEYTRIALRETDRLERLVNDLFQLTRLEVQETKPERVAFDAGSAVREAAESLVEPARREAGITLMTEIGGGDLRAVGDRARLVQVLQNLIRNAIRYTAEGGIILLGTQLEATRVVVTVRDTGVGIAPEDLPHVFDRFYRGDQSRNRGSGGAGLGLAIARQLVVGMGGTIAVESEVGEGTVFTIRLPIAEGTGSADGGLGIGNETAGAA